MFQGNGVEMSADMSRARRSRMSNKWINLNVVTNEKGLLVGVAILDGIQQFYMSTIRS